MAKLTLKSKENVEGNFFVDSTCIDCGTCYWVAPETFKRHGDHSVVFKQPEKELDASYRALFSCPTNSIGVENKDPIFKEVVDNFPYELESGVYHCGFHSEKSFGATSYFIKREEGNILIDSPRFTKKLSDKMLDLGGIDLQLLTHKDDVADTDYYWNIFQGKRFIHSDDASRNTSHYEVLMQGEGEIKIDKDLTVIPVPGHTKGSVCFLYKNFYLFTGDHLAFSKSLSHLYAFKTACWYDFEIQIKSMEKLLNYDFQYILPGHGSPYKANKTEMKKSLQECISWMKKG